MCEGDVKGPTIQRGVGVCEGDVKGPTIQRGVGCVVKVM